MPYLTCIYSSLILLVLFISYNEIYDTKAQTASITALDNVSEPYTISNPSLSVHDDLIYVIWETCIESSDCKILFKYSNDSGGNFSKGITLSNISDSSRPVLSSFGDNVYVAWQENNYESNEYSLMFRRSNNNGASFENTVKISNISGNYLGTVSPQFNPQISSYDNSVYMIWEEPTALNYQDIMFASSTDNGTTFNILKHLNNDDNGRWNSPLMFTLDNNIYVVANDDSMENNFTKRTTKVVFLNSVDGGTEFDEPEYISSEDKDSYALAIEANANNTYVLTNDFVLTNNVVKDSNLIFLRSSDSDSAFDRSNIHNSSDFIEPSMSIVDNSIYIVWTEKTQSENEDENSDDYPFKILFTMSNNSGAYFSKAVNLAHVEYIEGPPQLLVLNESLYTVWLDISGEDIADVVYSKGLYNGTTFDPPKYISNKDDNASASYLGVATSQQRMYIVWADEIRPGEIEDENKSSQSLFLASMTNQS